MKNLAVPFSVKNPSRGRMNNAVSRYINTHQETQDATCSGATVEKELQNPQAARKIGVDAIIGSQ